MKAAKAPRVPVLENAFEVNLPQLMRAAKATGSYRLVLSDGDVHTVAMLAETRLAIFLAGQTWVVDIVTVQCLKGRVRPLLKCPRAHEGNFQSPYWSGDEWHAAPASACGIAPRWHHAQPTAPVWPARSSSRSLEASQALRSPNDCRTDGGAVIGTSCNGFWGCRTCTMPRCGRVLCASDLVTLKQAPDRDEVRNNG
jgi:hypothetical protein